MCIVAIKKVQPVSGPSHDNETMNGPSLAGPPKPGSGKSGLLSPTRGTSALGGSGDNHGTNQLPTSMEQLLERQWDQGSQFLMEQGQHFDSESTEFEFIFSTLLILLSAY